MKLSNILKKYDMITQDLEYEIHFDDSVVICEPDYRFNLEATTQIRCYNKEDLDAGIILPTLYRSPVHFFYFNKGKKIKKITITANGDAIATFYSIENDLFP